MKNFYNNFMYVVEPDCYIKIGLQTTRASNEVVGVNWKELPSIHANSKRDVIKILKQAIKFLKRTSK